MEFVPVLSQKEVYSKFKFYMKILYHLGYPRTGSTYLQTNIFPEHKDINLIGPKNSKNWSDVKISQEELNSISSRFFDIEINDKQKILSEKKYLKFFDQSKLNVISSEKYASYLNIRNNFRDIKFFNKLLQENHKETKVFFLIVLRNQYDLIKSHYHHGYSLYSESLGIHDFRKLIECFEKNLNSREMFQFLLYADSFNFFRLYNSLVENFKNHSLKFLFYEDFKLNKDFFVREFSQFLDLDEDYTKKLFSDEVVNKLKKENDVIKYSSKLREKVTQNYLVKKIKNFIPKNIKDYLVKNTLSKIRISPNEEEEYRKIIRNYYKESNEKFFTNVKLINKYNRLY